jgi:hypothetical protein
MRIQKIELYNRFWNHSDSNESCELIIKIYGSQIQLKRIQTRIVDLVNTEF